MRIASALLVISLAAACSTASASIINSCSINAPVTSSLAFVCQGQVFDFGHDLAGNAINPLPLGGSLKLNSVSYVDFIQPLWALNFSFTTPSARTTDLQFSTLGPPCNCLNGADLVGVGMNASPIPMPGFNNPVHSGTNFTITETVTSTIGSPSVFSITNGGNSWGFITPGQDARALFISTVIVDRAGDLDGFNLAFSAPEPASWTLLAAGFAALYTFRRKRR